MAEASGFRARRRLLQKTFFLIGYKWKKNPMGGGEPHLGENKTSSKNTYLFERVRDRKEPGVSLFPHPH